MEFPLNSTSHVLQQLHATPLITLNYESKNPSSLENPVIDPNFNVMRKKEMGKSFAIPLVVGTLLLAVIAPLATWWYFSR